MPVYCPGCHQPIHVIAKDANGKQICPNPKCKIALVGNATFNEPKEG